MRRLLRRLPLILPLWIIAATLAWCGQVIEYYAGGDGKRPRARYTVDDQGRRQGEYLEFYPTGTKRVRAQYKDGLLEGAYVEYHETGAKRIETSYRAGLCHGPYIEHYPGKKPRLQCVYADGKRHGACRDYYPNGKPRSQVKYEAGALQGECVTYYPDGKPRSRCQYENDRPHGEYLEYHPGGAKAVCAEYDHGTPRGDYSRFTLNGTLIYRITYPVTAPDAVVEIGPGAGDKPLLRMFLPDDEAEAAVRARLPADFNGRLIVYPKTRIEIDASLRDIATGPSPSMYGKEPVLSPPYQPGELTPEYLETGLRRAQQYRMLCDLPYRDMTINPEYCNAAQHGTVLLHRHGSLSHTPPKPSDMEQAFYEKGYEGTSHSNLHTGCDSLAQAVDGFMDDSDASNIDRLGHRQQILHPAFRATGFGYAAGYAAMWVHDYTAPEPSELAWIPFPPRGYYPADMFQTHYAWSVLLSEAKFVMPEKQGVKVKITEVDETFKSIRDLSLNYFTVCEPFGPSVIFRPVIDGKLGGRRFWVEISGLTRIGGEPATLSYPVEFYEE